LRDSFQSHSKVTGKSSSMVDEMSKSTPPVPKSTLLASPVTGCWPETKVGCECSEAARGTKAGATVMASVSGGAFAATASEPVWQDCTCRRRVSLSARQHARLGGQWYWVQWQQSSVGRLTDERSGTNIANKRMDAHVCGCERVFRNALCGKTLRRKTRRPARRYGFECVRSW
jgi:hypothetical protein